MLDSAILDFLATRAAEVDRTQAWPAEQFAHLAQAGVLGWFIPEEFGGIPVSGDDRLIGYEELSTACLTTAFILTQRNGACQRIANSQNESLKARLLPALAGGQTFATVGISHLTTSRQHVRTPAVQVELQGNTLQVNGLIPWVTGAPFAQHIVTGGVCPDGRQVLIALPTDAAGVSIQPHARLLALTASHTATVEVQQTRLSSDFLLAGPVENVMQSGVGAGTGGLTTSVLALGLAQRCLNLIETQAGMRADIRPVAEPFAAEVGQLRTDLFQAAKEEDISPGKTLPAAVIRQRANSLALRMSQATLAISKGAGYVTGHPAELAVREALFFLVWSCPQPVVNEYLRELSCSDLVD
jgi:alkylation response protein AidB-like acyl-CoA dehydrogenase